MTTLREGLERFLADLEAYTELPRLADDPEGDARYEVCKAHATRVEQLLGLPDTEGLTLHIQPGDLCVWVVLPGNRAVRLADGVDGQVQGGGLFELNDRDRAIIRTLLAVAQNEANGHGQGVPVLPPSGAPVSYQGAPPAPWTWGL